MLDMDTPTPSSNYGEIHHILQQKLAQIVIVDALEDGFPFMVFPILLENGDGSPIRAVAGYEP
jgi:arylformamidase